MEFCRYLPSTYAVTPMPEVVVMSGTASHVSGWRSRSVMPAVCSASSSLAGTRPVRLVTSRVARWAITRSLQGLGLRRKCYCRDWIAMKTSETRINPRFLPRSLAAFLRDAHALRLSSERSQAMLWSRHVNRPFGAIIAQGLLPTSVSPNFVSIVGVILDLAGAALVLALPVPAPLPLVVVVFVVWQIALTLDNTDGLLARARHQSSPFGAWLDQIFDFVGHSAVIVSLTAFAARAFAFRPVEVAVAAPLVLAGSLIGLFSSAQRNALLGKQPALRPTAQARLRIPFMVLHLTDFGLFIAVVSVGLAWPPLLLVALAVYPVLITASVAAQVAINWPRRGGSRV